LKNNPKGFNSCDFDYLLRLKNYLLDMPIDEDFLYSNNLVENILNEFYSAKDFVGLINRAIDYVDEQETFSF
jgi:uncharacterized protein (DUF2461 family)